MRRIALLVPALAGLALLGTAAPSSAPSQALSGVAPGLWEVSRSATGHGSWPVCLRQVEEIATPAHSGEPCKRTVLADRPGQLLLDFSCPGGDFARSRISVITPRSLKLETNGLHRGEPFEHSLYARRKGPCASRQARR